MAENNLGFQAYLKKEIEYIKGGYVPVRAGFLSRLLIRRLACKKLHPNPEDEFCSPTIGPNAGIISKYSQAFRKNGTHSSIEYEVEPLNVERIRPDGYLILNGHHRWGAAIMTGQRSLPVRIVDLPLEEDINKMLQHSKNERRVTLDLDEVVFCTGDEPAEKPLSFPFNLRYWERLRRGIPGLFYFLNGKGYDVWVYSSNYISFTHIQRLFWLYRTHVTGIVTGAGKKEHMDSAVRERVKRNVSEHYTTTIHIDRQGMVRVDRRTGDYEEYAYNGTGLDWSSKIKELIGALDKNG